MRRRALLRGIAASAGLTLLPEARLGFGGQAAAAGSGAPVSGKIVARQVDHPVPAVRAGVVRLPGGELVPTSDVGSTGGGTISITSEVIEAGQLFERVGVHFRAAPGAEGAIFVEIRASDGVDWTEWQALHVDDALTDVWTNTHYIEPAPVPQSSRYAQYRVWLTGGDPSDLRHIALTFLDVNDLNAGPVARLLNGIGGAFRGSENGYAMAAPTGPSKVLTRQDWGADESLMKWTPKYVPWQKAIVHHTVTSDGGTNVAAEIRSIYYFHAVTRGWGDIGYNFIVDKYGNIWTGRQGGDNVVAGHAYGWNDGTLGVAALGDFSAVQPTGQMQGSIANVIALKFKQAGIQPFGSGAFTHEEQRTDGSWAKVTTTVANMLGHRDASYVVGKTGGQTACPGNTIYNMLNGLRSLAQNAWNNGYTYLAKIEPQLATGGVPGQAVQVPVAITNQGATTIPAGTLVNYRLLRSGALVSQGAGAALAQPIAPGGTGTATVPFFGPAIGEYIVRWDLQTAGAWWSSLYNTPFRDQWFRSADWDAEWLSDNVSRNWTAGEIRMITVSVRNDGGRTWPATGVNPVRLGYYWISTATGNRFEGQTKLPLPQDVVPGQTITLVMPVVAPVYPTNYTMVLDLYKENEFWFKDKGLAPDDTETTVATDFKAQYTLPDQLPSFAAGTTAKIPLTIVNTGRGTFPVTNSFPVNLGYHWYDTAGKAVVWDGARTKLPADLLSGQSVTVQADVTAPTTGGTYDLRFDLVQEGIGWFSDKGVISPRIAAAVAGPVIAQYGAGYAPAVSSLARSGGLAAVPFTLTNRSNFTWSPTGANPVTLSYHWLQNGKVIAWDGKRTQLTGEVAAGQSVTIQAQVEFPTAQGTYTLRWDLVHEGVAWFSGKGVTPFDQTVVVGPPAFYGGSIDVSKVPPSMPTRMTTTVPLRVQNMSNFAWDSTVNLSYHWYDAGGSVVVWDGLRTPLAGIGPNELRSLSATVLPPTAPGVYTLKFDIVQEGVTWFSGKGMLLAPIAVNAQVPGYGALYGEPATASGGAGAMISVPVNVTNIGVLQWPAGNAINLSYHIYTAAGAVVAWDGVRTPLPQTVGKDQTALVNAQVKLPAVPGGYLIKWDLVQEGITWFSGQGVPTDSTTLVVS